MSGFARALLSACVVGLGLASGQVPLPSQKLGALPQKHPSPPDNPSTPEKIALGRQLFFDPILSSTGDVACATCHQPAHGWADGRATPIGIGGIGTGPQRALAKGSNMPALLRNTPSILNVGFNGIDSEGQCDPSTAPMFWDSRVQSLEAQALVPIRAREEMRGDICTDHEAVDAAIGRLRKTDAYPPLFATAFPQDPAITSTHLSQAIAAFERSLITADTAFDRFIRGDTKALNALQQRGLNAFQQAGCALCHSGPMLSDYRLHFIAASTSGPDARRELRTPTLRNLKHTAPYMHDGRLQTLREVLVFYEQLMDEVSESLDGGDNTSSPALDPLLKHLNLKAEDFPALEAFLESLSAPTYDQTTPSR
jgi:cytochrome c peroxidase